MQSLQFAQSHTGETVRSDCLRGKAGSQHDSPSAMVGVVVVHVTGQTELFCTEELVVESLTPSVAEVLCL